MSDAPRTDEWYVTDAVYGAPQVFDKTRNDTICGIYGGKTIGEQYDIAARIAKLPDLERELATVTEQRDKLVEALKEMEQLKQKPCEFCRELPQTENEKAYWQEFNNTLGQLPSMDEWLQTKTQTEPTKL
jgi:hypothetical protein